MRRAMSGSATAVSPGCRTVKASTTRDGLPADTLEAIAGDGHGNVWMSTDRGEVVCRHADGSMIVYGAKDGLSMEEISTIGFDSDDSVWIGTEGAGLYR